MNRYLALPLALSIICFAGVYCSVQRSYGEPIKRTITKKSPLSFDQARTQILDGWPTLDEHAFGSRKMPTQQLYAELQEFAWRNKPTLPKDQNSILTSIRISARPMFSIAADQKRAQETIEKHGLQKNRWLPLHVDRLTHEVKIFHNHSWRPYPEWRDEYLPIYFKATGWDKKS